MNQTTIRQMLEYSPAKSVVNPELRGWWVTGAGGLWYVCGTCAGRIFARGCSLGEVDPVYRDSAEPYGICAGCER